MAICSTPPSSVVPTRGRVKFVALCVVLMGWKEMVIGRIESGKFMIFCKMNGGGAIVKRLRGLRYLW